VRIKGGGELGFGRLAARAKAARVARVGGSGTACGLNSPGTVPWSAGHASRRAGVGLRAAAARDSAESGLDTARRKG
jgi:hypothetical protein